MLGPFKAHSIHWDLPKDARVVVDIRIETPREIIAAQTMHATEGGIKILHFDRAVTVYGAKVEPDQPVLGSGA